VPFGFGCLILEEFGEFEFLHPCFLDQLMTQSQEGCHVFFSRAFAFLP